MNRNTHYQMLRILLLCLLFDNDNQEALIFLDIKFVKKQIVQNPFF
jgi:hypothetical protein